MKVFLAAQQSSLHLDWSNCKYSLESFYYFRKKQLAYLKKWDMFLLDSGAFTFMQKTSTVNFDDYVSRYVDFINTHDIKYFFELDIDSVVGLSKVEQLRYIIERDTGKKSIPVWHKSRGLDYYKDLCKNYEYIAIGGIASREIKRNEYDFFIPLLDIAKKNNCKVHGLGFTSFEHLKKYRFYSVDSTSWNTARFGYIMYFQRGKMVPYSIPNRRLLSMREANDFCLQEWIKYQNYADNHL